MTDKETKSMTIKGIPADAYHYFRLAVAAVRPKLTINQAVINMVQDFGETERRERERRLMKEIKRPLE